MADEIHNIISTLFYRRKSYVDTNLHFNLFVEVISNVGSTCCVHRLIDGEVVYLYVQLLVNYGRLHVLKLAHSYLLVHAKKKSPTSKCKKHILPFHVCVDFVLGSAYVQFRIISSLLYNTR